MNNLSYKIATAADAYVISKMRNNIEVLEYLHTPVRHSESSCIKWLDDIAFCNTRERIAVYYKPEVVQEGIISGIVHDQFVGLFRIDEIDQLNQTCYVGLDIDPSQQGNGYASTIYKHILDELFNLKNMRIIYLEVLAHNEKGIHIYKKLGFQECGRFPKRIQRFGREIDSIIMYIDRDSCDK